MAATQMLRAAAVVLSQNLARVRTDCATQPCARQPPPLRAAGRGAAVGRRARVVYSVAAAVKCLAVVGKFLEQIASRTAGVLIDVLRQRFDPCFVQRCTSSSR